MKQMKQSIILLLIVQIFIVSTALPMVQPAAQTGLADQLTEAAFAGNIPETERLLKLVNVNAINKSGSTPLYTLAMMHTDSNKAPEIVALLIRSGADVNFKHPENGYPVLNMFTLTREYPQLIVPILAAGANPNVLTPKGETALHIAAQRNKKYLIIPLLIGGANPYVVTPSDKMAVDLATDETVKAMLGNFMLSPDEEKRLLHIALTLQKAGMVKDVRRIINTAEFNALVDEKLAKLSPLIPSTRFVPMGTYDDNSIRVALRDALKNSIMNKLLGIYK
ncbi:MAG: ankyrin repeat domain-containing protein [Candidatus Babeliales bacterium]